MKKAIFYMLLMLVNFGMYAQDYEAPQIHKPNYTKQVAYEPIRFFFPDTVYKIIENYIGYVNDSTMSYYIELQETNTGLNLYLHDRKHQFELDTIAPSDLLLSSCYRYCLVNEMKIPIHFGLDIELGQYNYFITGTILTIRLERVGFGSFRVVDYSISK